MQCASWGFCPLVHAHKAAARVGGAQGTRDARSLRAAVPVRAPHKSPAPQSIRASLAPTRLSPVSHRGIARVNALPACSSRCLRTSIGE